MRKVVLLISLIVFVLGIGITYSAFFSKADLVVEENIAKFIFNAERLSSIQLPLVDLNPGEKRDYLFAVSNNEDNKISDVTIEYQIIIKTYHFIPFVIKLYEIEGSDENLLFICDETFSRNDDNVLICNTLMRDMDFELEEEQNYKLTIEFPSTLDDESYAGLVDFLDLEITSRQKLAD